MVEVVVIVQLLELVAVVLLFMETLDSLVLVVEVRTEVGVVLTAEIDGKMKEELDSPSPSEETITVLE